ncbi:MAG: redoxin domain-containing protein [Roseiflexaceae bacterium]|nr:redoxin domain-containing protein [Roseiflexaceae bacterium]
MRADIVPGATFPDYQLPDHTGTPRKLSLLQGIDPLIVMIGRGIYCPKDRQQLLQLVEFNRQLAVGFVRLVTITTDSFMLSNDLRLGVGADWPFLHDDKRVVQQDLDIAEYTDPHNNPMIPHTIVLEPGLKIYKIYNGYWYWGRPSTADLHADLREITQRIRFDWDLSDPAVRAAWDAGEKNKFYPYGASWKQVFIRMAGAVDQFE